MNDYKLPSKQSPEYWERTSESKKESKIQKKREDKNPWSSRKSW